MRWRSFVALSLILGSLLAVLALGGCGVNVTKVCNADGCCSAASDQCPAPQYLYANGVDGQIDVFPIAAGTGVPGRAFLARDWPLHFHPWSQCMGNAKGAFPQDRRFNVLP